MFKIKISSAKQHLIESYLYAMIAAEATYFFPKFVDLLDGKHFAVNFAVVGYFAVGAVIAPICRKLVAKFPFLSPFANKLIAVVESKAVVDGVKK